MLGTVLDIDRVIIELVERLPTSTTPTTPTFDTSDPSSYDTMLPRKHRMVPATHHQPLESVVQRYATMRSLQQPSEVQDPRNLEFVLSPNFSVDQMAEALRLHGLIYPLHTLYNMHAGRLPPLQTLSEVRMAIQRLLHKDALVRQSREPLILEYNEPFSNAEFNCLLRALIGGTIQPDLYRGRALPVILIASLQSYVDQQTNRSSVPANS